MKKNQKDNKKGKDGKPLNTIIPSNYQHIREPKEIISPSETEKVFSPQNYPNELSEEWPNEEIDINSFQKPLLENPEEIFSDPQKDKIFLPDSFYNDFLSNEIKWSRPSYYITEIKLDEAIKRNMPKKSSYKFREKIHEKYKEELALRKMKIHEKEEEHESAENSEEGDDLLGLNKKEEKSLYKEYFKILDTPLNISVVKFIEREENEDEYQERIKKESEYIENFKKEKKKDPKLEPLITEVNMEKKKIFDASPSNINMKDGYPLYFRWLASIYQIIKDKNIKDINTNQTIWQKIYPQEHNVPVYNPKGKYWVKLYHLGKLRKIEIDDTMPTNKRDKFYLPKCDSLEEIWPCILTKALLKLYSYKIVSYSFHECGDYEPFYSLTGFIPESFILNKNINLYKMFDGEEKEEKKREEEKKKQNLEEKKEEEKKIDNEGDIDNINESFSSENDKVDNITKENIENDNRLIFLQKVLSDNNYKNNQCLFFCFRRSFEEVKSEHNEIPIQRVHDPENDPKKTKKVSIMSPHSSVQLSLKEIIKKKKNLLVVQEDENDINEKEEDISLSNTEKGKLKLSEKQITRIDSSDKITTINNLKPNYSKLDSINSSSGKSNIQNFNAILEEKKIELFDDKIYVGVIYDIIEFFNNCNYNMTRLIPIDFSDLRNMIKNFHVHNVFKQLSREEKREYIHQLKEIKMKQKEEKHKRIQALKENGKPYFSIKISNSSVFAHPFLIRHKDEEIEMAKKCILNNWSYPPIEYLENVYKETHQVIKTDSNEEENDNKNNNNEDGEEEKKQKRKHYTWSKDVYMHLIKNNIKQYENEVQPLIREEGTWIEPEDFFKCFDSFIMLYNPTYYQTLFDWDNLYYDTNDLFSVNNKNKVLHFIPNENTIKTYIILLFSVNSDKNNKLRDIPFTIHFKLLDKNNKIDEGKIITLNSFFGVKHIDDIKTDEEYFLIFTGGLFPTGFYMKFLCDFQIENLPYTDYLEKYQKFTKNTFNIEHGNLQKNEISVLLRLSITLESKTDFLIVNNNTKDMYLNEFIEIFLCENGNSNIKRQISFDNIFELEPRQYYLVLVLTPPYNVEQNEFTIDVLSSPHEDKFLDVSNTNTAIPGEDQKIDAKIEQIEHISPYNITDKYKPNKHFILFKEFLFTGDIVYATLNIKLRRLINKKEEEEGENENENEQNEQKDKQNKNNNNNNENEKNELIEVPFEKPIRMKLELIDREKNIIFTSDFYNSITLHNIILETTTFNIQDQKNKKTKVENNENEENENSPYRLICYLDETELPEDFNVTNIEGIEWIIRIYPSDTIGFCEDTSKEDLEKAIINSWEENEPGRKEKAKNSRRRFLLYQKKLNGEELDEEEEQFLSEPRKRKNEVENEENNNNINNNKNVKGKDNKKGKVEEVKNEEKERTKLNFNKKTSTVNQHSSLFIKNFLYYAYDKRTITFDHAIQQEDKQLNTTQIKNEKQENIKKQFEDNEKNNNENEEDIEKRKNDLAEESKKIHEEIIENRKKGNNLEDILKSREKIKGNLLAQIEAEEKLKNLINEMENLNNNENEEKDKKKKETNKFDFNGAYEIYKEIIQTGLHSNLIDKAFNLLSKIKEESINEEITKFGKGKEKELKAFVQKALDDIHQNNWHISEGFMDKLDEIIA